MSSPAKRSTKGPLKASGNEITAVSELAAAFPFHLVISSSLQILAFGRGLAKMAPELRAGAPLDLHFACCEGAGAMHWDALTAAPDADFCLVHRPTGLELRGRMAITGPAGPAVFLGTSWLDDAEQLADFGVDIDQLNPLREGIAAQPGEAGAAIPPPAPVAGLATDPATDPATTLAETNARLTARCRQLEQTLRFEQAISRCLNEATGVDDALARLTEAIPGCLHWASAVLWRKDAAGELIAAASWPADATHHAAARPLAAQAFSSGAPAWSVDGCAGRGGFAIPLHGDGGTAAVISCTSDQAEPRDEELAKQLDTSAGQLARYLLRQQQTSRLKRLTSELTAIFQLSADGFVAFNGQDALSYLNPSFSRMAGIDRDELRGITEAEFELRLATLLDPRRPPAPAEHGQQTIYLSKPRSTVLQRSRRDARDIDGKLVGRLLYFRDITLESELLRANTEFLANAAHELRTPMASIQGFTELLLKRDLTPEKRRTVLETIHSQSSRLSEIVNELLEVARFDARSARDLRRAVQPLAPVIRATVGELLVRNDSRQVSLILPADSPLVEIDRDRFVQALTNVLSNAYKYSPDGGEISLTLRHRRRNDQQWVGVTVRDQGIGMSEEELQQLFERFFRAHPSGSIPGTGLGLSMVKKIIDAHGGEVEVSSAPGQGTTMTLWLPQSDAPAGG